MSFFSSIKRAFGFDSDDEPEFDDDDPATDSSEPDTSPSADNTEPTASAADNATKQPDSDNTGSKEQTTDENAPNADPQLVGDLFDGILAVFNNALPDFLSRCVDTEEQRKVLLQSLDSSLQARLAKALEGARSNGLRQLTTERSRIENEIQKLKERNRKLDERQNETNAQRLSAERQKRALHDRVHDLESQVAKLEAEKEQYELETKSMMSRMRAAGVSLTGEATIDEPDTKANDELIKANEALTSANQELTKANEELTQKLEAANTGFEQLKAKQQVADAMINGLQSKTSESLARAQEAEEARDTACKELDELRQQMAADRQVIMEVEQQISGFEAVKEKLDNRIAQLKEENALLKKQLSDLSDPSDKSDRSDASDASDASDSAAKPRKRGRRKKEPHISAIDEFMTSNDWFGAPTEEEEMDRARAVAERNQGSDDFGYKNPQRKVLPTSDDQLSLW